MKLLMPHLPLSINVCGLRENSSPILRTDIVRDMEIIHVPYFMGSECLLNPGFKVSVDKSK